MRRMLIVEDEQDLCDCLQAYFSSRGFAVTSVFSGEEAVTRLHAAPADVILLDILLPGISGMEVLRYAKKRYPGARIIIVTGQDRVELRAEARLYGACAYITKPFDFAESTWSSAFA
jgi:DNA-binding response OmpR family regulator